MKRLLPLGLAACMATPLHATPLTDLFDSFYVLGDSLSDNGNTEALISPFGLSVGAGFVQQPGVASNGFTWANDLVTEFGDSGVNLSFASARAQDNGDLIPDLGAQIAAPPASIYADGKGGLLDRLGDGSSRELVTFFVGGNDFRDAFGDPANLGTTLANAGQAVREGLTAARTSGVTDFILMNVPNFALIPEFNMLPDANKNILSATISEFNNGLFGEGGAADILRASGATVTEIDIFALLSDQERIDSLGPLDNKNACVTVAANDPTLQNCDGFLFWDNIHPSENGHQLIAELTREKLAETYLQPVPLPAPALMLLGGLGGLAAMRRRKRAS